MEEITRDFIKQIKVLRNKKKNENYDHTALDGNETL